MAPDKILLGCRIAGHWLGGLALADDIILLSLSVQGLQGLVNICEDHARRKDLVFSTDPDPICVLHLSAETSLTLAVLH